MTGAGRAARRKGTEAGAARDRRSPRGRPPRKEPDVPTTATPAAPPRDLDRHFRRAVWVFAGLIAIAAAYFYAGKAADSRSAFIRWRPQVLRFWQGENI